MSHANAALTPRARLRLARLVVESGWTYSTAAQMFMVAPRTARKWADRYRSEGPAGMADRSSRPRHSPAKTPPAMVRQIVRLRWRHRLGPVQIAGQLGVPASTVHAVLVRCRISRLSRIDRVTGEPLRRYEHDHPGSLIHIDVTKFGNIPDGGGWRYVGPQQGRRNRWATAARTGTPRAGWGGPLLGQWLRLPLTRLARRLHPARHHPQTNPPLPAPDQRQDRTLPPHPRRRLGLRPPLRVQPRPPRRTPSLAALLQSPPSPQRHRSPATNQPADQPAWTSQLGATV